MPDTKRLAELQTALKSRIDLIEEGSKKAIHVDGENVTVSASDAKSLRAIMREAEDIEMAIAAETYGEKSARLMAEPTGGSHALDAEFQKSLFGDDPLEGKDIATAFTQSEQFKAFRQGGGYTMQEAFEANVADLPGYGQKDVYTSSVPALTNRGFGRVQRDAMVPRGQRQNRVRDLFPVARTDANLIDYFRVTGFVERSGDGNAAAVGERLADNTNFALKPKSNLQFQSAQAPVRLIAHWEAAHRNVLADEPQLQATINNELMYGLALEEDRQILSGSGTNEELLGILNTSGIQAYTQKNDGAATPTATETKADAVRRALTRVIIANYEPRGVVLHPFDWEDIELTKTTEGQYVIASNVSIGAEQRLWRQPVVATVAIPQKTFLSGAFGLGAQLYDRAMASIRIAEQHADFFVRNAVAILAEERLALAIKRPESFVKGTFI